MLLRALTISAVVVLMLPFGSRAQSLCEDETPPITACPAIDPPAPQLDPTLSRLARYVEIESKHRLCGLASYYSTSLDGTLTATGEIFRNRRLTAAHLTLPLGCWIEVRARATGKSVRLRVNDRGPYVRKFCLDLSQAAARLLGVDVAEDRHVDIRIVALPGEKPVERRPTSAADDEEGN